MPIQQCLPSILLAAVVFCLTATEARAGLLTFTATGPNNSLQATASFVPEIDVMIGSHTYNGILLTLTNTLTPSNNLSDGVAVSGIQFQVSNGLGPPTALLELDSSQVTLMHAATTGPDKNKFIPASITPYTSTGPFPGLETDRPTSSHWGFDQTASTISLGTVDFQNLGLTGKQPYDLIIPQETTPYYTLNSSADTHTPSLNGSAAFFLEDNSVTSSTVLSASTIKVLSINFGTGPTVVTNISNNGQTSGPPWSGPEPTVVSAVPVPPSAILMSLGTALCVVFSTLFSRRLPDPGRSSAPDRANVSLGSAVALLGPRSVRSILLALLFGAGAEEPGADMIRHCDKSGIVDLPLLGRVRREGKIWIRLWGRFASFREGDLRVESDTAISCNRVALPPEDGNPLGATFLQE